MSEFNLPGGPPALKQAVDRFLRQKLSFIWRLWTVATTGLPTAVATDEGALLYDETVKRVAVNTGAAWATLQPYDATIAALAALDSSAGVLVQTGADTFAKRTLTAPAAGFTITNPAGTAGNPTFVLANDLAGLEGLSSTGFAARTTTDTWAVRTLTAPAAGLTISNPAGIAGDPTFALANDLAALEALSGTSTIYYRSGTDTWTAVTIGGNLGFSGGTLGSSLGTAATVDTGTSGATLGLLNNNLTFSGDITFTGSLVVLETAAPDMRFKATGANAITFRFIHADATERGVMRFDSSKTYLIEVAGTQRFSITSAGVGVLVGSLDVQGALQCDSLRIDQTPTAATPTPTHTFTVSLNGTTYRIPCVI